MCALAVCVLLTYYGDYGAAHGPRPSPIYGTGAGRGLAGGRLLRAVCAREFAFCIQRLAVCLFVALG